MVLENMAGISIRTECDYQIRMNIIDTFCQCISYQFALPKNSPTHVTIPIPS